MPDGLRNIPYFLVVFFFVVVVFFLAVEDFLLLKLIEGVAQIGIDDFSKVELRICEIKACEKIKRAKKLLKLTLDDGEGERTVASGISQWYAPEDLTGHKVVVVSNLKPAKLCGVESQGMILAADNSDGNVQVLFADNMETGAKLR